jgi:hypothetical protein
VLAAKPQHLGHRLVKSEIEGLGLTFGFVDGGGEPVCFSFVSLSVKRFAVMPE